MADLWESEVERAAREAQDRRWKRELAIYRFVRDELAGVVIGSSRSAWVYFQCRSDGALHDAGLRARYENRDVAGWVSMIQRRSRSSWVKIVGRGTAFEFKCQTCSTPRTLTFPTVSEATTKALLRGRRDAKRHVALLP